MDIYVTFKREACHHFDEHSAEEAARHIEYTDRDGSKRTGAYWSKEEILKATEQMSFKDCVTEWDRYVAFNAMYADLCRVLTDEQVVKAAHAFFFADEDAPCGKIWRYVQAMKG